MPIRKRAVTDTKHPPGEARIPWRDTLQDNIKEYQASMWARHSSDEQLIAAVQDNSFTKEAQADAIQELDKRGIKVVFKESQHV
jgi:hypothetical protein